MGYTLKNMKYSPLKNKDTAYISSGFGSRTFYNGITKKYESSFHNGIDLAEIGTVVSFDKGVVKETSNSVTGYSESSPRGNYIVIEHDSETESCYYHLKKDSIMVKKGDRVERGTELATIGATGHATGVHLHFGIKKKNRWVNPEDYLVPKNTEEEPKEDYIIYKIKRGDTLSGIAASYNTDYMTLARINNIQNPNLIIAGRELKIPANSKKYIVKKGDSLWQIASKYGTSWQTIYEKNKDIIGENPNLIIDGMELKI